MSFREQIRLGIQRVAEEIETVKSKLPDTTSSPIATTDDAANLASGFVDVFSASEASKSGEVAATLGVIQSPPLSGTGGGETDTPVKLAACRETLLFINGTIVNGFQWGDVYEYSGSQGDLIESNGMCGAVLNSSGSAEGVMPMNHLANSGRQFHNFFFRNANPSRFFVTCGPVADTVRLVGPNPNISLNGSSPDEPVDTAALSPSETVELNGSGNGEYYLYSENGNPFFVSRYGDNRQFDQMVVFPPSTKIVGHCRNANLSVIFPDTEFTLRTRLGNTYTGVVQPGSPLSIHALTSATGESGRVSYDPEGYGIITLNKPGSCISGADEAGIEITSWQSVDTLGQQGALPLPINEQSGNDKVRSSLSFASEMTGTVKVWIPGATSPTWQGSLVRDSSKSPVSTPDDQKFPSGARYFASASDGQPSLPAGTRWQSDVPVYVVANYYDGDLTDTDETVLSSVTPEAIRAETRRLSDDLIYRRVIEPGGSEEWSLA